MSQPSKAPTLRELSREESEAILQRNNVGRIAYAIDNHVEIQPVSYVYADGWLYGRTSYGRKYEVLGENLYQWWPVVFEVDETEDIFNWRSVIVHGGFYVIDEEAQRDDWLEAVRVLRTLIPDTFGPDDPFAFRTVVFRIAAQDMTGRESSRSQGTA